VSGATGMYLIKIPLCLAEIVYYSKNIHTYGIKNYQKINLTSVYILNIIQSISMDILHITNWRLYGCTGFNYAGRIAR
jgi:hypothetical protein